MRMIGKPMQIYEFIQWHLLVQATFYGCPDGQCITSLSRPSLCCPPSLVNRLLLWDKSRLPQKDPLLIFGNGGVKDCTAFYRDNVEDFRYEMSEDEYKELRHQLWQLDVDVDHTQWMLDSAGNWLSPK